MRACKIEYLKHLSCRLFPKQYLFILSFASRNHFSKTYEHKQEYLLKFSFEYEGTRAMKNIRKRKL